MMIMHRWRGTLMDFFGPVVGDGGMLHEFPPPADVLGPDAKQRKQDALDYLGISEQLDGIVWQDLITVLAERVRDLEAEVARLKDGAG